MINFSHAREKMVLEQIEKRGIKDSRVLAAMKKVERHKFVDEGLQDRAYKDSPLPIGQSQTISQPYIVALMTEKLELKENEKVLEIGTGSGYQAAVLAELCEKVFSIERDPFLAKRARKTLDELGYGNIIIKVSDGTLGWKEFAPYDGIIVTAGAPMIPHNLLAQLRENGKLVIPVGDMHTQRLCVVTKKMGKYSTEEVCNCAFVPLIGVDGWSNEVS
ncbi:MAG: protein-L-isoaspartate(D-aspartate) O-methyltransferase [Candidatus Helarchaeota archaeon]|nr:protein-L-isoaspartate(D-aspartate) O-methyltransferase [Candidatus Helarchaeota archaeon]